MARLLRFLNVVVIAIGAVIVWNERRNPARSPAPQRAPSAAPPASSAATTAPPASSATAGGLTTAAGAPGGGDAAQATPPDAPPDPTIDELTERQNVAAEARFTTGAPTAIENEPDEPAPAPPSPETASDLTPTDTAAAASPTPPSVEPDPNAVPAGAVGGDGSATCPPDHPIKGNASSMIYHRPGQPSYERTVPEFCFASEPDAEAAGYRPPKR